MALEKRRLSKQVDFITSIGYGDGSPDYGEKAEPTDEDLRLLRDVIDAEGYFLKRVVKK